MDKIYQKFRNSMFDRLSDANVEVSGDELSIKNVLDALTWNLEDYDGIFIKGGSIIIERMKKESKKGKTNLGVDNIAFNVLKDGSFNIEIDFITNRKSKRFKVKINEKLQPLNGIPSDIDGLDANEVSDFLKANSSRFEIFFEELSQFVDDYPGIDFHWDVKNSDKVFQTIGDSEFSCDLKLLDANENRVRFTEQDNLIFASISDRCKDELYEYLDFYNDEIASKTRVNINDLDDPVKMFVKKYYGFDKGEKLTL